MSDSPRRYTEFAILRLAISFLLLTGVAVAGSAQTSKVNAAPGHGVSVHTAPVNLVKAPPPATPEPVSERKEHVIQPSIPERREPPVVSERVPSRVDVVTSGTSSDRVIEASRSEPLRRTESEPDASYRSVNRSEMTISSGSGTGVARVHDAHERSESTASRGPTTTSPSRGTVVTGGPGATGLRVPSTYRTSSDSTSTSVPRQMNVLRSGLTDSKGLPVSPWSEGRAFAGGSVVNSANGWSYRLRADGTAASARRGREFATLDKGGKVSSLRTPTLSVASGAKGRQMITARHPDHSTLVSTGRHSGYLEREVKANDPTVVERIYVSGSRSHTRRYERRLYMGTPLKEFRPLDSYSAGFGAWTSLAWPTPAVYRWGWTRDRWYGRHNAYFSVWPSYRGVNYWLTDYLLGSLIMESDDSQQPDGSANQGATANSDVTAEQASANPADSASVEAVVATPISPEVKEAIASEVQQEISLSSKPDGVADDSESQQPSRLSEVIVPGRVFVVGTPMFVDRAREGEHLNPFAARSLGVTDCDLSQGDLLRLDRMPLPLATGSADLLSGATGAVDGGLVAFGDSVHPSNRMSVAVLEVVAGQKGDCAAGTQVKVALPQLEEMENEFRARVDDGLRAFSTEQGKSGLPAVPPGTLAIAAKPATASPAVAPMLQELRTEAKQAEKELAQTVPGQAETTKLQ